MVMKLSRSSSASSAVFAEADEDHYREYSPADLDGEVKAVVDVIEAALEAKREG